MQPAEIIEKSLRSSKYLFIFKILSQTTSLLVTVLLVRALSEAEYGVYNLFYSVIPLMSVVASFGLANTLQRYMPEYYSRGEYKVANNLYRMASVIRLLSNIIILGLCLVFWEVIAPVFKLTDYKNCFMVFTLVILIYIQRELLETCLNSFFLHKYTHGLAFFFALIRAAGYGIVIIKEMDFWMVIIIDLSAHLLVFVLLQFVYAKRIPIRRGELDSIPKEERQRLFRYSLYYNFNDAGVGILGGKFDNFIIVMYLNQVAVGAYSFCLTITHMIERLMPMQYFIAVIRPAFFSVAVAMDNKHINKFYQIMLKVTYVFYFPVLVFLLVFSTDIINIIFAGKFVNYAWMLFLVFLFNTINAFNVPVSLVAQLKERADIILYSKIFAAYNIFADIVLIKYFGLLGAVLATGTANFGKNFFIWYFVRKEASFSGMSRFFMILLCYWCAVAGCLVAVQAIFPEKLLSICLGILILAVGVILQFRFRLFDPKDLELFRRNIKSPILTKMLQLIG